MMELTRERVIDIIQNEPMGQIYLKLPEASATAAG
jgi:chromatin segregation and condensation protein Rec8/ScpA/Scc1 (kleisin family)